MATKAACSSARLLAALEQPATIAELGALFGYTKTAHQIAGLIAYLKSRGLVERVGTVPIDTGLIGVRGAGDRQHALYRRTTRAA